MENLHMYMRRDVVHASLLSSRLFRFFEKTFRLCFSIQKHHLSDYDVRLRHTSNRKMFKIKAVEGTAVAQWLRCCATNQKVAGSIPAGVIGIFH